MTGDNDRLTDADRRSMRILATSTKAAAPANARIADRLERAAGSGDPKDYRRAEASFDALPVDERRRIGTHAEKQAETERRLDGVRKRRTPPATPATAGKTDDTLDWKPLLLDHSPATDPADDGSWRLGGSAPKPAADKAAAVSPTAGRPAEALAPGDMPAVPRPAGTRAGTGPKTAARVPAPGRTGPDRPAAGRTSPGPGTAPPRPKKPPLTVARPVDDDLDEQDKGWDWQRIPEDPVLRSRPKKSEPLDPFEALRREILGDDSKKR